jgi:hypothetical protein
MADGDDEYVSDERLARELEADDELELEYNVIPKGIRIAYDRLSRCSRTVTTRLEYLVMLVFSAELVSAEQLGFDVSEFVRGELADIKLRIVRRNMVTTQTADFIQFMEDVLDMQEDTERQGEASELLARLKASGSDIHAFYRGMAAGMTTPTAPEKGCVVCYEADPTANFSSKCTHPHNLCADCLPRVQDTCPVCRATVQGTSSPDSTTVAALPRPPQGRPAAGCNV